MEALEKYQEILKRSKLLVAGDRISVEEIPLPKDVYEALAKLREIRDQFVQDQSPLTDLQDQILEALDNLIIAVDSAARNVGQVVSLGGGRLHKALHKSLHKSLHKGLHKGLHKSLHKAAMDSGGGFGADGLSWPVIEVPWREIGRLYRLLEMEPPWNNLPLKPPPTIEIRLSEIGDLHKKQKDLREPQEAFRRDRIRIEATNDITAYMIPLGADTTSPASQTAIMFQTILWLGSMIGLQYKAAFNAARPHVLDPSLEPFIPVPAYSSYPSNHAFQSFLIAEVFARAVPEHPGGAALYRAAKEVAVNREWAGLHIRSDTVAGHELARMCATVIEEVLKDQIRAVRAEWLGEGYSS